MIRYALKCEAGHGFDSWFQSAAAFDSLARGGHLSCAVCGSAEVRKSLMAPRVTSSDSVAEAPKAAEKSVPVLSNPPSDVEKALTALRKKVESTSDYVGKNFVREARDMHAGRTPERAIYGEARLDQARALVEEGVPLMPLPFKPKRQLS
ncbi:hypothetical protein A3753_09240 [Sulfitobacter sp. HI0082]|uniref:DUF1178 family protein n=1 Tax=uncultured Sulfitobacter sp. TaxID=191468 RepID=UPI0007CF7A95|nr:hypothetical protein A3753_09240 [Sulfitobacter sp. HI0082]|tara:strand:+ start:2629 stop:3078 length:450 start_codon:yes stop_codon:yes gene_type:complete